MHKNIEIEFKTQINDKQYHDLIQVFGLENNIFKQTNYYFDTNNLDLNHQKMVLRIRTKRENSFKLTLKSQSEQGAFEYHVFITKEQAEDMKKNGFHTKNFFEHIDYFVTWQATLDNFRASTPYEGGTLFLDYNEYCGEKDYEVEFEVDHYESGFQLWQKFLDKYHITYVQTKRKSERALTCVMHP